MADIDNGAAGRLVIPGVHDGRCGIQAGPPLTVAFRWTRTGKRPEPAAAMARAAIAMGATFDGVGYEIGSLTRSPLSAGFYQAVLTPAAA